ncbi:MAG: c-type cytochrome, partial [Nevskiales bacterium]
AENVDLETGRPVEVRGARYENGEAMIWPGSGGMHNWHPMAFSPDTGLMYIPTREMAGYYNDGGRDPRHWKMSATDPMGLEGFFDDIPTTSGKSALLAWNPITQEKVWEVPTPGLSNGGVITTKGNLVFQGRADGRFVAQDAETGEELWAQNMGVGTQAPPMSFSVDGKQYVAVLAGWGGSQMLMGSMSAQHGWVGRQHPRRLVVYTLDGEALLPASPEPSRPEVTDDPDFVVDAAKAEIGKKIYFKECGICHGSGVVAGGYAPDLRASPVPLSESAFAAIVHAGALVSRGMPVFPEFTAEDQEALRHYIRQQARHETSAWDDIKAIWNYIVLMIKMTLAKHGW